MANEERVINFFPGPSALPVEVSLHFCSIFINCYPGFEICYSPIFGRHPNMAYVPANMEIVCLLQPYLGERGNFKLEKICWPSRNTGDTCTVFFIIGSCW